MCGTRVTAEPSAFRSVVVVTSTAKQKEQPKLATVLACAAAFAFTASAASAAVVCNDEGDCWRVKERRDYDPGLKLRVYNDDWKWKDGEKYRWRDAGARHGYYRGGVWIDLD